MSYLLSRCFPLLPLYLLHTRGCHAHFLMLAQGYRPDLWRVLRPSGILSDWWASISLAVDLVWFLFLKKNIRTEMREARDRSSAMEARLGSPSPSTSATLVELLRWKYYHRFPSRPALAHPEDDDGTDEILKLMSSELKEMPKWGSVFELRSERSNRLLDKSYRCCRNSSRPVKWHRGKLYPIISRDAHCPLWNRI